MLVVVGLGNPGAAYAGTRHNLGFMVVDELLRRGRSTARRDAGEFEAAESSLEGQAAVLVKPLTYVNRSGRAVQQLQARLAFEPREMLVVVDDVYLPFGRLRLRPGGSAGGHNGLQSLLDTLGTTDFPRLRLGVGAPADATPLPDWVLAPFSPEERAQLGDFVARAADAVALVARLGVEAAMPGVNAAPPLAT